LLKNTFAKKTHLPKNMFEEPTRMTRLVEFLTNGQLFTMSSLLKKATVDKKLGLLLLKKKICINFEKKIWATF
jgi:hypothetical protein